VHFRPPPPLLLLLVDAGEGVAATRREGGDEPREGAPAHKVMRLKKGFSSSLAFAAAASMEFANATRT
jgi:hypothetical protein